MPTSQPTVPALVVVKMRALPARFISVLWAERGGMRAAPARERESVREGECGGTEFTAILKMAARQAYDLQRGQPIMVWQRCQRCHLLCCCPGRLRGGNGDDDSGQL